MAVAVSRALERGAPGVICASTGNTAASAAAYAARAGLPAVIVAAEGRRRARESSRRSSPPARSCARSKGSFDDAHALARRLADDEGWVNVNSINPDRIEGQASAAREIVEQLGAAPDVLALPYGGGGNTRAYLLGLRRRAARGCSSVQSEERGVHRRLRDPDRRARPPRAGRGGRRDRHRARGGAARVVARRSCGSRALFCEPASAAGVAGVAQVRPAGRVSSACSPATG